MQVITTQMIPLSLSTLTSIWMVLWWRRIGRFIIHQMMNTHYGYRYTVHTLPWLTITRKMAVKKWWEGKMRNTDNNNNNNGSSKNVKSKWPGLWLLLRLHAHRTAKNVEHCKCWAIVIFKIWYSRKLQHAICWRTPKKIYMIKRTDAAWSKEGTPASALRFSL